MRIYGGWIIAKRGFESLPLRHYTSKFKITPFSNPSGITVYRLSGTLNGKRIRENYPPRPEAVAKRQEYDVEHLNGEPEGQDRLDDSHPQGES